MKIFFIILLLQFFFMLQDAVSSNDNDAWPAPFTSNNKILSLILSFSFMRFDPLLEIFREYRTMCNAGWAPTIVIFTANTISERMVRFLQNKVFCHRIEAPLKIIFEQRDASIGRMLADETRRYMHHHWQDYDLVTYQEEDIIFEYNHLIAYLKETKTLWSHLHKDNMNLMDYSVGFQRYRRHLRPFEKNKQPLTERELLRQEFYEEIPFFKPICINNQPYLEVIGDKRIPPANVYQAMWILTKTQIEYLNQKCHYTEQSLKGTPSHGYTLEYMASLSLYANDLIGPSCDVKKLIPADQLTAFSVWHYYHSTDPQLIRKSNPVFATVEHIQAGMLQMANPGAPAGYFMQQACWKDKVIEVRQQRGIHFHTATDNIGVLPLPSSDNSTERSSIPVAFIDYAGNKFLLDIDGMKHLIPNSEVMQKYHLQAEKFMSGKHHMFDAVPRSDDLK